MNAKRRTVVLAASLTAALCFAGCSAPEEMQTDPRGAPPSGKPEGELIREALDQEVAIPEAGVNVDVQKEPE